MTVRVIQEAQDPHCLHGVPKPAVRHGDFSTVVSLSPRDQRRIEAPIRRLAPRSPARGCPLLVHPQIVGEGTSHGSWGVE